FRDHRREGDERRRVARPAALDREEAEVDVVAFEDDLLADALRHDPRLRVGDRLQLQKTPDLLADPLWRLHVEDVGELGGCVVEPLDPEREAHAPLRPELVDQERIRRAARLLEEERGPARLDDAVRDLGDLEVGVDLRGYAQQLAVALEEGDPVTQILCWHRRQSMERSANATAS